MRDEAYFLSAIDACRADPAPRLAYANWLEARGDSRAEYLRLQHQLAVVLERLQHVRSGLNQDWMRAVEVRRDLVLHSFPPERRREVFKLVRTHTAHGAEEARALLSQVPVAVLKDLPLERAERVRQEFAPFAVVTIEPTAPVTKSSGS